MTIRKMTPAEIAERDRKLREARRLDRRDARRRSVKRLPWYIGVIALLAVLHFYVHIRFGG